jgi:hypothetical protein
VATIGDPVRRLHSREVDSTPSPTMRSRCSRRRPVPPTALRRVRRTALALHPLSRPLVLLIAAAPLTVGRPGSQLPRDLVPAHVPRDRRSMQQRVAKPTRRRLTAEVCLLRRCFRHPPSPCSMSRWALRLLSLEMRSGRDPTCYRRPAAEVKGLTRQGVSITQHMSISRNRERSQRRGHVAVGHCGGSSAGVRRRSIHKRWRHHQRRHSARRLAYHRCRSDSKMLSRMLVLSKHHVQGPVVRHM